MFVWMAPLTTVSSHSIWEKTVTYELKYYQSTWEWTWWIMRQHTDVIKYGREATSVIKLHAQFEHICPDSWEIEMHNRLVNAAPRTQKHQQHVICGLISLTVCSVRCVHSVAWYNLLQSTYWNYHCCQTCWEIDVYVDVHKMAVLSYLFM